MKISIFFLILAFCKGMNARSKCDRDVPYIHDPYCGITPECYQNAFNNIVLDIYSCKRMEKGLPGIQVKQRGKCPTDKPECPKPI